MDTKPRYPISVYLDTYKIFSISFNGIDRQIRDVLMQEIPISLNNSTTMEAAISKVIQDKDTPNV